MNISVGFHVQISQRRYFRLCISLRLANNGCFQYDFHLINLQLKFKKKESFLFDDHSILCLKYLHCLQVKMDLHYFSAERETAGDGENDFLCIGDHICLYCTDTNGYVFSDRTRFVARRSRMTSTKVLSFFDITNLDFESLTTLPVNLKNANHGRIQRTLLMTK